MKDGKDPSDKQRKILHFIDAFIDEHDYPPSIRQIQEACSISSTSVVDYNLRALEKRRLHPPRTRDLARHSRQRQALAGHPRADHRHDRGGPADSCPFRRHVD